MKALPLYHSRRRMYYYVCLYLHGKKMSTRAFGVWFVLGVFPKCELCLHEQYYNLYCMYIHFFFQKQIDVLFTMPNLTTAFQLTTQVPSKIISVLIAILR